MKKETKENIINLTALILDNFMFAVKNIARSSISRKEASKIFNDSFRGYRTNTNFSNWLYKLKSSSYIEYDFSKNDSIIFTNKTKVKLIGKLSVDAKKINGFHFLSFDIPEKLKWNRYHFRAGIKQLGFKKIQRSLWVTNKDVFNLVQFLAREYKVEKYIANIVSKESDIDGIINKILSK